MKKRFLSLALVLVMALSLLPTVAFAANSDFTIENGVLTGYIGSGGDVVIPDGVTSIGEYAFYECKSLTSITIPSSVTQIGGAAFFNCESLTSVTLPDSVTSIGEGAFGDCTSLTSITIPSSVTQIGGAAFSGTPWLKAQGAFPIVNGILLSYQGSETSVTIPNSVTSIGHDAFSYRSKLTSVTIPDSVTSIGYEAFSYCSKLTSVMIPDSVTSIEDWAFVSCIRLTSVTISNSVTSIGEGAFFNCPGLTDVYYGGSEAQWKSIDIRESNTGLNNATIHYNPVASSTQTPATPTAYASTQNVLVDGKSVEFQCYALKDENGNDTNYIKLRDVASILNGTAAQFNVGWDGNVNMETGKAYVSNGSEMSTPYSGNRAYENATTATNVNGKAADLSAIVLKDDAGNGYTYYKLRDLGNALGFKVDWSAEKGIFIETN